jgi:hypothetical protein
MASSGGFFSGFFWFYALLQIPTGMILDPLWRRVGLPNKRLSLVAHFGRDGLS